MPPDSLLVHPCKASKPGETLIDLAKAYNHNNGCIAKYKKQLEAIKSNKEKQKELHNVR